jgi:TatD DNase family protein
MLHCVRAFGRLLEILREEGPLPAGFLLHAYGGSAQLVERFARLNAYFSFAAFSLDKRRPRSAEALRAVPADRLLLETDCPDPKTRTEPSDVRAVLSLAARLRTETEERLEAAIWENGRRLLGPLVPGS